MLIFSMSFDLAYSSSGMIRVGQGRRPAAIHSKTEIELTFSKNWLAANQLLINKILLVMLKIFSQTGRIADFWSIMKSMQCVAALYSDNRNDRPRKRAVISIL